MGGAGDTHGGGGGAGGGSGFLGGAGAGGDGGGYDKKVSDTSRVDFSVVV